MVQKYGGTSVGSVTRIKRVSRRIAAVARSGQQVVVVVSAMGRTTDNLISLGRRVSPDLPARELDMLVANGETIAAPLVAMCLQSMGVPAISLTGAQAGVLTTGEHSRARIVDVRPGRIQRALDDGVVPVVAGFQGTTADLEITTLGRGGSDTTAVALAGALGAEVCEILTDVDGVLTADPRMVPQASLLHHVAYGEMLELAMEGTKVLHPRAVELGKHYDIPIHVRSSFHDRPGTMVVAAPPDSDTTQIRGIAYESRVGVLSVGGGPADLDRNGWVVDELTAVGIAVDVIATALDGRDGGLTLAMGEGEIGQAKTLLRDAAPALTTDVVTMSAGLAKISVVGREGFDGPDVVNRLSVALATARIDFKVVAATPTRVTCLVPRSDGQRAVQALHAAYGLSRPDAVTARIPELSRRSQPA